MDSNDNHDDDAEHAQTDSDAVLVTREQGASDQVASREQHSIHLPDAVQGEQPTQERSAATTNRRAVRRQRKRKRR